MANILNRAKGIWRNIDRVDRLVFVAVIGLFLFLAILGFITAALAGGPKDDPELCVLALEDCRLEHSTDAALAKLYKAQLDALRERYKAEMDERERMWQDMYEEVKRQQAGVECWARVVEVEKQLEDEEQFYHWRLKSCGAIREKTKAAIKRYEKQVDELLTEREQDNWDE